MSNSQKKHKANRIFHLPWRFSYVSAPCSAVTTAVLPRCLQDLGARKSCHKAYESCSASLVSSYWWIPLHRWKIGILIASKWTETSYSGAPSVWLFVQDVHTNTLHAGPSTMMAILSEHYHILTHQTPVKCQITYCRTAQQLMRQLPAYRDRPSPPFYGFNFLGATWELGQYYELLSSPEF